MPERARSCRCCLRPAPVAIHNDRHVARQKFLFKRLRRRHRALFLHLAQRTAILILPRTIATRRLPSLRFSQSSKRRACAERRSDETRRVCLFTVADRKSGQKISRQRAVFRRPMRKRRAIVPVSFFSRRGSVSHANLRRNARLRPAIRLSLLQSEARARSACSPSSD